MRKDFRIAGSGGQGIIMLSVLIANAYGIYEGYEIAQSQSYGVAARGGASQASVIVSDRPIEYIEVEDADIFVAFNEMSYKKYITQTTKDSLIFIDSTNISEEQYGDLPNQVYTINATSIAEHQFKPFMANMVMLGFMAAKLGDIGLDSLEKMIAEQLPAKSYEMNIAALHTGYEMGVK